MTGEDIHALKDIASWLNERTGIYYPEKKLDILKHKLFKICIEQQMNIKEIAALLMFENGSSSSSLALMVASAASTNHTAFFREDIWEFFKDVLAQTIKTTDKVRIWSAAASSGEEAYSIAIVAAELLGLNMLSKKVTMLGTDIDFQILKQAEEGIYPPDRMEDIEPDLRKKYFTELSDCSVKGIWKIHDDIKNICLFRRMNLKKRPYPFKQRFHIIFCRNVLYYFIPDERERIVNELYRVTENGGYLFVSVTESLTGMSTPWQRVPGKTGIYRKKG